MKLNNIKNDQSWFQSNIATKEKLKRNAVELCKILDTFSRIKPKGM